MNSNHEIKRVMCFWQTMRVSFVRNWFQVDLSKLTYLCISCEIAVIIADRGENIYGAEAIWGGVMWCRAVHRCSRVFRPVLQEKSAGFKVGLVIRQNLRKSEWAWRRWVRSEKWVFWYQGVGVLSLGAGWCGRIWKIKREYRALSEILV